MQENQVAIPENLSEWGKKVFPEIIKLCSGAKLSEVRSVVCALMDSCDEHVVVFREPSKEPKVEPLKKPANAEEEKQLVSKLLQELKEKLASVGVSVHAEQIRVKNPIMELFEELSKLKPDTPSFGDFYNRRKF